jgi:hypothetical protein
MDIYTKTEKVLGELVIELILGITSEEGEFTMGQRFIMIDKLRDVRDVVRQLSHNDRVNRAD